MRLKLMRRVNDMPNPIRRKTISLKYEKCFVFAHSKVVLLSVTHREM